MPKKSHWNSHADLLNGTELFFFFGTGLVQPDKETNEKSMKYILFFWPRASGKYGPLFELKRQIFDIFHWPNLLREPRICYGEPAEPKDLLDHPANARTCFSRSRDDHSPHDLRLYSWP